MKKNEGFLFRLRNIRLLEIAWLFLLLGTLSFKARTATESLSAQMDSAHLIRLAFDGIALVIVMLHFKRVPRVAFDPINIFLGYAILGVVSTLWSASPVATLGKSGEIFIAAVIIWKTLSFPDSVDRLRRLLDILLVAIGLILTYTMVGYFLFPEIFTKASRGLIPITMISNVMSGNSLAYNGSMLALTFAAKKLSLEDENKKNNIYIFCYLYFAAFPILAQGRTGMLMLGIGTIFLLLMTRKVSTLIFAPLLVGGVFYAAWSTLTTLFLRGQDEQLLFSMSNRTVMWGRAWDAFWEDPVFGNGFAIGSRLVFLKGTEGFDADISSVHNGFLEVLLGIGTVGFLFWIVAFVLAIGLSLSALVRKKHLDVAISFFYVVPTTIMSTGAGGWMSLTVAYFLVTTAYLVAQKRLEKKNKQTLGNRNPTVPISKTPLPAPPVSRS